ncbi:MAG: hypothetical protein ABIO43_00425 [Sphingomicrobium sp.]
MTRSILVVVACALLTVGCARTAPLKPAPGQSLPVKPLMAATVPTPEQLLVIPDIARPQRVDELMRRSEPREPDRFDLPPPDGGAAPTIEGEAEPALSDQDTGPVQKQ